MLSLGNHPRALGAEAQVLLSSFELCEQIELKEESRSEKTGVGVGPRDPDNHVIELGWQDGKAYTLTFSFGPRSDPPRFLPFSRSFGPRCRRRVFPQQKIRSHYGHKRPSQVNLA